jgi:hypothetical protein
MPGSFVLSGSNCLCKTVRQQPCCNNRRRRIVLTKIKAFGVLIALGSLSLLAVAAHAISTAPALVLTSVDAVSGSDVRIVRLEGVFPGEDLVQQPYPLQVLIRETQSGKGYVLYDLSRGAFEGNLPDLVGGLSAAGVRALDQQGEPAEGAALMLLARDRLEVSLPVGFPNGPAEAVFFVIYKGTPILSNAVSFVVEAPSP